MGTIAIKRIFVLLILLLVVIPGWSQNDAELFEAGNTAYNSGKYEEAIKSYTAILDNDMHSAELYFNLANAHYKLNQIAPSIYFYEKALQLDPKDEDIQNNLRFAQNMTIDAIETVPELGLSRFLKSIVNALSTDVWAVISVVFIVLFVIFFLSYYFSIGTARKRFMFVSSFICIFLAVLSLSLAFQRNSYDLKDKPAIVFASESEVKSDPNLGSETAFKLHEGTKVQVLETYERNWSKIRLSDGKTGWISNSDIKLLNIF